MAPELAKVTVEFEVQSPNTAYEVWRAVTGATRQLVRDRGRFVRSDLHSPRGYEVENNEDCE